VSQPPSSSFSQLAARSSGYYLDVYGASTNEYAGIDVWYDNCDANQQFTYPDQNGQVAEIVSENSSMCLTTDGTAGDTLYQYPCQNAAGQMWQAEVWTDSWDYRGQTMVTFLNPSSGLVIDIYDNSYDAGATVDAWYPNQQTNQAFVLPVDQWSAASGPRGRAANGRLGFPVHERWARRWRGWR
jgi:hypothetical protein